MNYKLEILHRKYSQETGDSATWKEIQVYRSRGKWILDSDDEEMLGVYGNTGFVDIPPDAYIDWLEEIVIKHLKIGEI